MTTNHPSPGLEQTGFFCSEPRASARAVYRLQKPFRSPTECYASSGFVLKLTALCLVVVAGCASGGSKEGAGSGGSLFGSKGAPWTIRCLEIQGPARMRQIEPFAESLRRTAGIRPKDVFIRDESDGFARLYYGTYYRRTDPKTRKRSTPPQLQTDMELIKQLGNESGQRYFLQALAVRMPMADVGNPQWALYRATGVYSLQVAVFEPNDDFWEYKQAAAEYCEFLRKKGYEAYYHHASAASMVTVGSFGPDAVVNMPQGLPKYSSAVLALQKDDMLKYNLLNGGVYYVRDGKGGRTPVPSRLVEIPRNPLAQP